MGSGLKNWRDAKAPDDYHTAFIHWMQLPTHGADRSLGDAFEAGARFGVHAAAREHGDLVARVAELEAALAAIEEDGTEEHNAAVNLRQTVASLRSGLTLAAQYFGAPSDANFDGFDDDEAVSLSMKVRIGDLKKIRALLNKDTP